MSDWLQYGALGLLALVLVGIGSAIWFALTRIVPQVKAGALWVYESIIKPHLESQEKIAASTLTTSERTTELAAASERTAAMMERFQPTTKDPSAYETIDTNAALLEVSQQIHRIAKGMNIDDEDLVDRIRDILADTRKR